MNDHNTKILNSIISGISRDKVHDCLLNGNILIYIIEDRKWIMWYENSVINYSSSNVDIEDPYCNIYLANDIMHSYVTGTWFVVQNEY